MNYEEIIKKMDAMRDNVRFIDRYFKENNYEWIIGDNIFREMKNYVQRYYNCYPKYDDLKIMGIPVTLDYIHRDRLDLMKNACVADRDIRDMWPESIYITTASRPDDSLLKKEIEKAMNAASVHGYFKQVFPIDDRESDVMSLYPKTMPVIAVHARRGGKTTFSVLEKLDHEFYHNKNWKEALEVFMDKHDRIKIPEIDRVIYNNPATIVFWKDGTKTVVKAQDEAFDEEKGLAMAIVKKLYGNDSKYFNKIKKHLPKIEAKPVEKVETSCKNTCDGHCDKCCPVVTNNKRKANQHCREVCKTYANHFNKTK